jgi:hypothetical protein
MEVLIEIELGRDVETGDEVELSTLDIRPCEDCDDAALVECGYDESAEAGRRLRDMILEALIDEKLVEVEDSNPDRAVESAPSDTVMLIPPGRLDEVCVKTSAFSTRRTRCSSLVLSRLRLKKRLDSQYSLRLTKQLLAMREPTTLTLLRL